METFHAGTIKPPGTDIGDAIWQALAESRALVAIISPDVSPDAMGFVEIGAAAAWNKPVFLLINGPSTTKLPPSLSGYPVYPLGRLEEVVQEIRTGFQPLRDNERGILADVYLDIGIPADQLSQSPKALRELTRKFNRRTNSQFSGERLLSELIWMRKKAQLPRLRTSTVERVKSVLRQSSRSFEYLRDATGLNLTDKEFGDLIEQHPDVFESTRIIARDKQGKRTIPGRQGIKLKKGRAETK